MNNSDSKIILTINGSDSTGGSGVQADIRIILSTGGYAVSAITSVTVQNTLGIQEFHDLPSSIVAGQIEAVVNDMQPQTVKIGMLRDAATVELTADIMARHALRQIVYDPIIVSSQGEVLMSGHVVDVVRKRLLPLCRLVVMKKDNAAHLLKEPINSTDNLAAAARHILSYGCEAVLIHGCQGEATYPADLLMLRDEGEPRFITPLDMPLTTAASHGFSGNLSAAIASFLSAGNSINDAVDMAYRYMNAQTVTHSAIEGRGNELYHEFVNALAAHHSTNSDVAFYADKLNVSSRYLAQVTKRIAAKSPKTIIDEYIIHEAQTALSLSGKTVQQTAFGLGFNSQAHFTKFFRKMTGLTPSQWRRQRLSGETNKENIK